MLVVAFVWGEVKYPAWEWWLVAIIVLVSAAAVLYVAIGRIRAQREPERRQNITDGVVWGVCFLVVLYGGDVLFDFGLTSEASPLSWRELILAAGYMAVAGFTLGFGSGWLMKRFHARR